MYTHTCTYAHKQRARMPMVTYMHTYPNMSSCTNGHSHKCAHVRTYPTYVNKEHIRVDTSTHKLTCAHRPRQGPSTGGKTQKPQESQVFTGPGCVMVLWATGQVAGTRVRAQVDGEPSAIQSEPTCPHHALMGARPIPSLMTCHAPTR